MPKDAEKYDLHAACAELQTLLGRNVFTRIHRWHMTSASRPPVTQDMASSMGRVGTCCPRASAAAQNEGPSD